MNYDKEIIKYIKLYLGTIKTKSEFFHNNYSLFSELSLTHIINFYRI